MRGNSEGKKTTTTLEKRERERERKRERDTTVTIKQHSPTSGPPGAEGEVREQRDREREGGTKTGNIGEFMFMFESFIFC